MWTIVYTCGTTGLPKGVQATHRGVLASMPGLLVAHRVAADSRCLTVPLLYARCRVQTVDDRPAAPGETGELQVAGPLVTPGYWRNPAATAEAFTGAGWLRTGDAATVTADGHIGLVDRWKEMYIAGGGERVPAEVENVLHAHPVVSQAAVVGAPHPRWGEAGVAFVVPAREARPTEDDPRTWCRERLAAYTVPVRVVLVDELPRDATGKVLKAPLRRTAGTVP